MWLWWDGYGAADGPGGQDRGDACSQTSGRGDGCAPHHWSTCSAGQAMRRSNANEGIRNCFLLDSEGLNSSSVILWVSFGDNPRGCCFCGETFGWLGCRLNAFSIREIGKQLKNSSVCGAARHACTSGNSLSLECEFVEVPALFRS